MFNFLIHSASAAVTLPNFSTTQELGVFISDIYKFSISIVGILIFVQFFRAGWKYLRGGVVPSLITEARSIMLNCVIGALLLFSSWLILYVINPDLVGNGFKFDNVTQDGTSNSNNDSFKVNPDTNPNPVNPDNSGQTNNTDTSGNADQNPPANNPDNNNPPTIETGNAILGFDVDLKKVSLTENPIINFSGQVFTSESGLGILRICDRPYPAGTTPTYKVKYEVFRVDGVQNSGSGVVLSSVELDGNQFGLAGASVPVNFSQKLLDVNPVGVSQTQELYYSAVFSCYDVVKGWTRMSSTVPTVVEVTP